MATLPEEFPVVLTIFLALGAWRISQHHVLTRRVPAVEMLGAATVLCVDKTGTLTINKMTITQVCVDNEILEVDGKQLSLPEKFHSIIEYAILSSPADPFDPMEKAMKELGGRTLANIEHIHKNWELVHEYPISDGLLAMSHVWRSVECNDNVIAAKGAPEAIASLCHLSPREMEALHEKVNSMADNGLRVIGVAMAKFTAQSLPKAQHDFDFEFSGLLGLVDPVRPELQGWDTNYHDHWRLPWHSPQHCPPDRTAAGRSAHHRS
jgi:Ca2+-transporting ATPase